MPFDSPDLNLGDLLGEIEEGKVQLPDFQREWKWDNDRITSLLASISLDYPIGVLMMLQVGGEDVRFKPRPISGAGKNGALPDPERLLLDGQQRMTSLFQSLKSGAPVDTTDAKGKKLKRWYYLDIACALDPSQDPEDAVVGIPHDKLVRGDFGRSVIADYSTIEKECEAEMFPLANIFDMGTVFEWNNRYIEIADPADETAALRWQRFYKGILQNFVKYTVPVIVLTKETPKEAVCTVFEKVNTGGVVLDVFELLTATFAADDYRLNEDWRDRRERLSKRGVLTSLESTDFLQAVALVNSYRQRAAESETVTAVSCRRKDILRLQLEEYKGAADVVTEGFEWAAEFLSREKIFAARDVPYRSQLVPLAALRAIIGPQIDDHGAAAKVRRWYWCGVLGELYGGAIETRFARDVEQVPEWLKGGPIARSVEDGYFEASRLETLKTRNSAAYKGVNALLLRRGIRDWIKNREIDLSGFFELGVDIHHVFPRKWCDDHGIDARRRDSIINKTPISWDTNRSIGGRAPSSYVRTIEGRGDLGSAGVDALLAEHLVSAPHLRSDDFEGFYGQRKDELIDLIASAMDKEVRRDDADPEGPAEYEADDALPDPAEELAAVLEESEVSI